MFIIYPLITGVKIDIGEVIFNDLVNRLMKESRQKYVSYPRFLSCAIERLLGPDYEQP